MKAGSGVTVRVSVTSMGGEVRRARKDAGLSLRALGARIGVSAAYLTDVEHGRRSSSAAFLARLAAAGLDPHGGERWEDLYRRAAVRELEERADAIRDGAEVP